MRGPNSTPGYDLLFLQWVIYYEINPRTKIMKMDKANLRKPKQTQRFK